MVKTLGVGEIHLRRICNVKVRVKAFTILRIKIVTIVKKGLHMADMISTARESVDALHIQTKKFHRLKALVNNHRNSSPVSGI